MCASSCAASAALSGSLREGGIGLGYADLQFELGGLAGTPSRLGGLLGLVGYDLLIAGNDGVDDVDRTLAGRLGRSDREHVVLVLARSP